jgi:hypothetical protein
MSVKKYSVFGQSTGPRAGIVRSVQAYMPTKHVYQNQRMENHHKNEPPQRIIVE